MWAGFNVITTAVGRDNIAQVADILSKKPIGNACLILCENDITCFKVIHAITDNVYQAVVDRIIYSDGCGAVIGEDYYSFSIFNNRLQSRPVLPECVRIGTNFIREHITKLYLINTLHSIIAWAAYAEGSAYINNALRSTAIKNLAEKVGKELEDILTHRFSTDLSDAFHTFSARSLSRFANKKLFDPVERVGRNALHKLGKNERIFRPILYARKFGLAHDALLRGAAYGQLFHVEVEDTISPGVVDNLYNYIST
jgi:mannitol-1-phosphate/altronate dehydrogenase